MKSAVVGFAHELHVSYVSARSPRGGLALLPEGRIPDGERFEPDAAMTEGLSRGIGLAMWVILIVAFFVALWRTGAIYRAHKDGGQASFVGLGLALLTVIASGSVIYIFNWTVTGDGTGDGGSNGGGQTAE